MISRDRYGFDREQRGVTILEFIAFVGLAALVVAGALSLYGTATEKTKEADLIKAANGIANDIKRVYPNGYPDPQFQQWGSSRNRVASFPTEWLEGLDR